MIYGIIDIHHCEHLQFAFKKYGEQSFKFYILEYVKDLSKLLDREDYYLQDYFDFDNELYNECFMAGSLIGIERFCKTWLITFPDKHQEKIKNLASFCRDHNLSASNIIQHGHTKGYFGLITKY